MIDLHLHSTASDGTNTPTRVVELAAERNLRAIALTDHDSVEGVEEALAAGRRLGVTVIPALELSSETVGEEDVHLLGYGIDYEDPRLAVYLKSLRQGRVSRAQVMVRCLRDVEIDITFAQVMAIAGEGAVGRSHVARALVAVGAAADIGDAFKRYVGLGQPCFRRKDVPEPPEAVKLLKSFKAVVVMAHPGIGRADERLPELVEAGLDGIEAHYFDHTPEQVERFKELAHRYGLIWTGGSDCHGEGSHRGLAIGTVAVPDEAYDQIERARRRLASGWHR